MHTYPCMEFCWMRTLTFGGRNTVQLVSSLKNLDSTASLHTNSHMFSFLAKSNLVKLETGRTVILLPKGSVLCNKIWYTDICASFPLGWVFCACCYLDHHLKYFTKRLYEHCPQARPRQHRSGNTRSRRRKRAPIPKIFRPPREPTCSSWEWSGTRKRKSFTRPTRFDPS